MQHDIMDPKLEKALEYTHLRNWARAPDFYNHELTFKENFQKFKTAIDLLAKEKKNEKWMAYKVNAANMLSKILTMEEFQTSSIIACVYSYPSFHINHSPSCLN